MILQMFLGLAFPAIHIGISTTILRWTNTAFIGRVNGVIGPMFTGGLVLTSSIAGVLLKSISLVAIYCGAGLLMLIGLSLLLPIRKLNPPS
jgi:DHA3 family macrolide efflux protein-like MFS transporter